MNNEIELTAALLTIEKCRELSCCPDGVDLQDWVKQLAAENVGMKSAITDHSHSVHFCEVCGKDDPCSTDDVCYVLNETPATARIVAGIKADAWMEAKDFTKSMLASDSVDHLDFLFDGKIQQLREGADK
ncbi:hypothetical protein ABLU83_09600 [Klebsiella sp. CN_Kp098]|uniref:hypothetical protein n=1 Tax=unclassified Klebsiella TaxID=2608929 RepID=UPI0032B36BD1